MDGAGRAGVAAARLTTVAKGVETVLARLLPRVARRGRPTMDELRLDLRAVSKKCRPDWDITTPELRAAWQQGNKALFYPYGKTYLQTLGEQD